MAKGSTSSNNKVHTSVVKRTKQGGKVKRGSMNKTEKRNHKPYRGQGR